MSKAALLLASCAIELSGQTPPEWVELLPGGAVKARDGRSWRNDDPAAVIAATRSHAGATDPVVDYEHQTDLAPANGQPAPAAGWMRDLEVRDGAIWGRVEWTAKATEMIAAREYRYLSPVFFHDKAGRIKRLARAALTNKPALELPALAREEHTMHDTLSKALKKVLATLGLTEEANETAVEAALARYEEQSSAGRAAVYGLKAVATALNLDDSSTSEEIVAAAKAAHTPDPGAFVPRSEFDKVARTLAQVQDERAAEKATAAVDEAIGAGKVTPAQRDWALAYARAGAEGFERYCEAAPVILAPGSLGEPRPTGDPDAALTEDELAVCKAMGLDAEKFKESRKADLARLEGAA